MIDRKLLEANPQRATQTLLHELIHSTTSRALHLYDNGFKELLSKAQQEAIAELKDIYELITSKNKDKQWISYGVRKKDVLENKDRIYGLKNEHEMLAELANKDFREFLKEQNIFVKIINAIKKFFGIEEKQVDSISTNAFKELEQSLYKIIDNYENPQHFTSEFDRIYNIENFIDFDNYRKYIKDNYERFKEAKRSLNKDYLSYIDTDFIPDEDGLLTKTYKDYDFSPEDFKDTELGKKIIQRETDPKRELALNEYYKKLDEYKEYRLAPEVDFSVLRQKALELNKMRAGLTTKASFNETMLILEPLFKSDVWKSLPKEYVEKLFENIDNIYTKNLIYNKKKVNNFFAREYVQKEVEKLQHAQNALALESKFLNNKGGIDFKALESEAVKLPKALKFSEFKKAFGVAHNQNIATIKTPIKDLEIDVRYAFLHLNKAGKLGNHKENRSFLSGAVLPTLQKPLFVTKDTKRNSIYFYKPFIDENRLVHFVSVEVDKNSRLHYKTSYEADTNRLLKMIRNNELLYFSKDNAQPSISTKGGGDV